mgnify:CR=1 FL=1
MNDNRDEDSIKGRVKYIDLKDEFKKARLTQQFSPSIMCCPLIIPVCLNK